ncbi:acetylornithine transaminase [Halobacillus salinarum]|uniref:Acetylornithine aminotransferase n=1 Tax=Halobacillus salinarum TaxID=2932257 RepID=A0ABY4EKZ6_9BACI|nr:acetylornithine transaminase [Halobacillus salinarum]UOQ45144.1 acetylornithine transaminase [Halobacillus salinarum]
MNLFPTYKRFPINIVSGKGTVVTDENGKDYLDFVSGIAVCNLGHCPENVKQAVEDQMEKIWHVSNLYQLPEQEEAASWLTRFTELDHVFFCNSGAEANEAAIKLARKYTGKEKIYSFKQSFHGRTFATMSATGQEKIQQGYGTLLPTFEYLPYNDPEAVNNLTDENTAAIMVEVIQGEGGVIPGSSEFLQAVQKKCEQLNCLLIIDEVQTGIGRTGYPFAYQHHHLDPDIVTSAKGLGSGFPVGAMLGKSKLKASFSAGAHGTTFGGNPLATAAVTATLNTIFNDSFLKGVRDKGAAFKQTLETKLAPFDLVETIRGQGLMIGIVLKEAAMPLLQKLQELGLMTVLAGPNVIRLLPPLTVTESELNQASELLETAIKQYQDSLYSQTTGSKK